MMFPSFSRPMLCRCPLGEIVFWTGHKRDVVCLPLAMRWIALASIGALRLPHAQQRQAGNTTDAYTAPHHH